MRNEKLYGEVVGWDETRPKMLVPARAEHYIEPLSPSCANLDTFVPPRPDCEPSLAWISERFPNSP